MPSRYSNSTSSNRISSHDARRVPRVRLVRLVVCHRQDFEDALHRGQRPLQLRERVDDVPDRVHQQERVPLERHDVADRGAADDVQVAAVPDDHDVDGCREHAPRRPHQQLAAMREQLLAQDRLPAEHVVAQLARLARERADDADAGERLADAAVDAFDVLAHRSVDRPDAAREREADRHHAGDDGQRRQRQPPVQQQQDGHGDDQPDERDRRRDDRHLQQSGRRLDVAGEPRQDAARLHVPELRQRQVEQPVEERAPERQHDPDVQQALAVVLEDADEVGEDDDADERGAGEVEERESRRRGPARR